MQLINFPSLGYLCSGPFSLAGPTAGQQFGINKDEARLGAGLRVSLCVCVCVDSLVSRFFPLFRALYDITRTEAVHFFKQCLPDSICNGIGGRKCNCVLNMRQPYMKISRAE